jgi:hypothetical protein
LNIGIAVLYGPSVLYIQPVSVQLSAVIEFKGIINLKQVIWYGHVERMDQTRLSEIAINWKPEGRKKRGRPRRTWKDGIYTAVSERDLRMGDWNNRRQWNMEVGRRRQTF